MINIREITHDLPKLIMITQQENNFQKFEAR